MYKQVLIFITLFSKSIYCQEDTAIIGAWFWADSNTQISIFIKQDSNISMFAGNTNAVIKTKDLLNGKYSIKQKNHIKVDWNNNQHNSFKYQLINNDLLMLKYPSNSKTYKKFVRIIDE